MRQLTEIIIHCAATSPDWMKDKPIGDKVAEIDRWHKDRGWSGIGYHYVIDRTGVFERGRPLDKVGAHVKGHNTGTIGICLIGGHGSSANDDFFDHFTGAQDRALRDLIRQLQSDHPTITKVTGHNEYAAKACPGFRVAPWLNRQPTKTKTALTSTTMQAAAVTAVSVAGGVTTAVGSLDRTAQIVVIVLAFVALAEIAWIMRERIKKLAAGV
jgi:N-acetylmuramoyl-L-alanine amidase